MSVRWLLACGVVLSAGNAFAQAPTELPPLLTPPAGDPNPPPTLVPRGPAGEYDHGRFYLPEYVPPPPAAPEQCRPLGRWWVAPTFEFAWVPTRPIPAAIRLRVPDGTGGTLRGPILPTAGRAIDSLQAGFGLVLGRWFGETNTHGVEASFYFTAGARTFTGFVPGMFVVFPGGASQSPPQVIVLPPGVPVVGLFPATLSTQFFGADVNYRRNLLCGPNGRLDALAGYRFAFLRDELYLGEPPDGWDGYDANRAAVGNAFHGGQVGLAGEYRAERWYVSGAGKIAFGAVTADVSPTGLFVGAEGFGPDGSTRLRALKEVDRTRFAVLPTANVTVGRQVGEHCRLFAGYTFQYLSEVTRLADVLDPARCGCPSKLPTADFWVQAVNLGVEVRY